MNVKRNFLERLKFIWRWKLDCLVMLFTGRRRRTPVTPQLISDMQSEIKELQDLNVRLQTRLVDLEVPTVNTQDQSYEERGGGFLPNKPKVIDDTVPVQPKPAPEIDSVDGRKAKRPEPKGGMQL